MDDELPPGLLASMKIEESPSIPLGSIVFKGEVPIGRVTSAALVNGQLSIEAFIRRELVAAHGIAIDRIAMDMGFAMRDEPPVLGSEVRGVKYRAERITIDLPTKGITSEQLRTLRVALAAIMGGKEMGMWDSHGSVNLDPHGKDVLTVLLAEAELIAAKQKALQLRIKPKEAS